MEPEVQSNPGGRRPSGQHRIFSTREYLLGCAVILILGVALMAPILNNARDAARSTSCYGGGNTLSSAISIYAADYDERLPPASQWADLIRPGVRLTRDIDCPTRPNAIGPHSFNKSLDRQLRAKVNDQAPMLFESNAGRRNHADLLESFTRPHKGKGWVVLGGGAVRAFETPPDARFGQ